MRISDVTGKLTRSVAIILGIFAVIGPIVWEYYAGRSALELRILSSISLEGLTVNYEGTQVKNLTKFNLLLINTGRTPICSEDVKQFPTIVFGGDIQLLKSEIVKKEPVNLVAEITDDTRQGRAVLKFALLNPSDYIEFNAFVSGKASITPLAYARIKGIKGLGVADKRSASIQPDEGIRWLKYPIGLGVLFCVFLLVPATRAYSAQIKARRLLRKKQDLLSKMESSLQLGEFIAEHLSFITSQERGQLFALGEDFMQNRAKIILKIKSLAYGLHGTMLVFYMALIIVVIGLTYILWG